MLRNSRGSKSKLIVAFGLNNCDLTKSLFPRLSDSSLTFLLDNYGVNIKEHSPYAFDKS